MLDTIGNALLSYQHILLGKFLHDLAKTEDMSRLTLGVGEQVLHPVCYGQLYKIKRISYYPAVTRLVDIEKKRFPLTGKARKNSLLVGVSLQTHQATANIK